MAKRVGDVVWVVGKSINMLVQDRGEPVWAVLTRVAGEE
jgi:hypothetical protein